MAPIEKERKQRKGAPEGKLPKEGDSLFDPKTSTVKEKPCLDQLVEGVISNPTLGLFPSVSNIRSTAWEGSGRGSFRGGGSTKWTGSGRGGR